MPAAAVASFTPAIAGISGTSVGARGEMVVDMRAPSSTRFNRRRTWAGPPRLARHIGLDLRLDLLEVGGLAGALFLDLDDVPAELRLHGVGDLAGLEREGDGGEFRHHLFLGEEAEIAAIGGAGVLGLLLRQLG